MKIAITRPVSANINQCELTHITRQPIDLERARRQHAQYEQTLQSLGVEIHRLPALDDQPDAVFVEDVALVLDECAILTNPGAVSRRPEVDSVADALRSYRETFFLQAPGTLDGGDVLRVEDTLFVGLSDRSNQVAVDQLEHILHSINLKFGSKYHCRAVQVSGCLHLKSAVTQIDDELLLVNPDWIQEEDFPNLRLIRVDPTEPYAANALRIGDTVIYPSAYTKTKARLLEAGIQVVTLEADELAKAEGALTCCSLLLDDRKPPPTHQAEM
jgi:dimethylargininase